MALCRPSWQRVFGISVSNESAIEIECWRAWPSILTLPLQVVIDGRAVACINSGQTALFPVEPGKHTVALHPTIAFRRRSKTVCVGVHAERRVCLRGGWTRSPIKIMLGVFYMFVVNGLIELESSVQHSNGAASVQEGSGWLHDALRRSR